MIEQAALPFDAPVSIVEREFATYIQTEDGRALEEAIERAAHALVLRGWKHYGIAALVEKARYDRGLVIGPDGAGYKINNNHRAHLARHLMAKYPYLAGFFETRELRGRAWRKRQ